MSDVMAQLIAQALMAKRQALFEFLAKANVVGCGVGFKIAGEQPTEEPCVTISVARKLPQAQLTAADLIPKFVGQVKTDVVETGVFRALQVPADGAQAKMRPARPGVSIGHQAVTAGTFGCLVRRGSQIFILGNNHVLANLNNARPGDAILQPGPADGGTPDDKIAELAEFVPLDFGESQAAGCADALQRLLAAFKLIMGQPLPQLQLPAGSNRVDCALARPLSPDLVSPGILRIGRPLGVGQATLGDAVQKFGRTTGHTHGRIIQIDVSAAVDFDGRTVLFHDQLMAGPMSQGGDSGSAVLDSQARVVGLLFAGSDSYTLINPIQAVLDALRVDIVV